MHIKKLFVYARLPSSHVFTLTL